MAATTANHWHQTPQARAVIGRIQPGELRQTTRIAMPLDEDVFVGLTDRADRHLKRLEALRREAVDVAARMTFDQADADDADRRAWLAINRETDSVFDVLKGEFEARAQRQAEAA